MARRYADAITELGQVLDVDPGYPMALIRLGLAHTFSGRQGEGIRVLQFAADHAPDLLDCRSLLGYALAVAGRRAEAERQLTRLRELAAERYVPPFLLANIHIGLGEHDEAITCIEREYDARSWYLSADQSRTAIRSLALAAALSAVAASNGIRFRTLVPPSSERRSRRQRIA